MSRQADKPSNDQASQTPESAPTGAEDLRRLHQQANALNAALDGIPGGEKYHISPSVIHAAELADAISKAELFLSVVRDARAAIVTPQEVKRDAEAAAAARAAADPLHIDALQRYYAGDPGEIPSEWKADGFHYRFINVRDPRVFSRRTRQGYVVINRTNLIGAEENIPSDFFKEDGTFPYGATLKLARCPVESFEAREAKRQRELSVQDTEIYGSEENRLTKAIKTGSVSPDGRPDPRSPSQATVLSRSSHREMHRGQMTIKKSVSDITRGEAFGTGMDD